MNEDSKNLYTPETPLLMVKSEFDKSKEKRSTKKTNLRKTLKGKAWLLYKEAGTLIIDDVHGIELVCRSNQPANIKGIKPNLLARSAALQTAFDAGLMEVISHQQAARINDTFSKNIGMVKMASEVTHTDLPSKFVPKTIGHGKPVVNRESEIKELEITDADCHGPTLEETLAKVEEFCKTHPLQAPSLKTRSLNDTTPSMCSNQSTFEILTDELLKRSPPKTPEQIRATPTEQVSPSPADQFRAAGHRAVDSIADMMIAFRKM